MKTIRPNKALVSLIYNLFLNYEIQLSCLLGMGRSYRVYGNVGDIVSSDEDVSMPCDQSVFVVFFCVLEHHIHIHICVGHPAPVLPPVLEGDSNVISYSFYEGIERLLP